MAYVSSDPGTTPSGTEDQTWVKDALQWVGGLFDGNPRAGGADPCCPPGYDPAGTWPRNANEGGAPPDYRSRGAPMESPSPRGEGRLKDDFCDCIPILYSGRFWMLGGVTNGRVELGPPEDMDTAVYVEVSRTGVPLSVPGFGTVVQEGGGSTATTTARTPSSGGESVSGGLGPLLGIGAAGLALKILLGR